MMQRKISKDDIYNTLEKICKSSTFIKSPRNCRLLKFIVEQSLQENFIKEQVIGLELFKKGYKAQTNDAKVRVYMHNLRKRLKEYYVADGKNDKIVFEIIKGQYNVAFSYRRDAEPYPQDMKKRNIFWVYGGIVAVVLMSVTLFWLTKSQNNRLYCWNQFFENGSESVCVISDHNVLFGKLPDGSMGFIRNTRINREKELAEYLQKYKGLHYEVPDFTFITKMAPMAVKQLTKFFIKHDKDFSILIEADFSFELIRDKNLILIGQSKTMGKSRSLFLRNSGNFNVIGDTVFFSNGKETQKYQSSIENNQRIDYTIVSFFKLENNRSALLFSSNNDIGVIASVKHFTDLEWLNEFYSQFPENEQSFHALFKVAGLGRTDLGFELMQIEFVNENSNSE